MRAFGRSSLQSAIRTIALVMCFPLSAAAESLQCGEALIAEGSTQAEVTARCGQPSQIQRQTLDSEGAAALPGGPLPGPAVEECFWWIFSLAVSSNKAGGG